jgi:hypothetical protein
MEAWRLMAVQKYGSTGRGVKAWGEMSVHKYGSMRRDGCTEIWKHEERWPYRNIEA